MLISEFIDMLVEIQDKHGDQEIRVFDMKPKVGFKPFHTPVPKQISTEQFYKSDEVVMRGIYRISGD